MTINAIHLEMPFTMWLNLWKNGPGLLKLEMKLENEAWLTMRCPRVLPNQPHIQPHSKQSILNEKTASANQYIRITWNSF